METNLIMEYDRVGDILYLGKTTPYPEQESEELDYGIVARLNPKSREIENLEILFFSKRMASGEALRLPVFAQFRGGMGLATMGGGLISVSPLGFLLALGTLILLVLVIRHSARASFFAGFAIPALFWLVGFRETEFWIALLCGLVIAVRFTIDWNRKYRELWLDREKKDAR